MASGLAALSWEVIWQIKSSLALGVSAKGTAITLAVTMGGMSLGAFLMGHVLKDRTELHPARIYGLLEVVIGLAGLCLSGAFRVIEQWDTWAYNAMPGSGSMVHMIGIAATLGIPTICMGATLPVFGFVARQFRTSIAVLYGLNTLGAAAGSLIAAFFLIPAFGITHTSWVIAGLNIVIGMSVWMLAPGEPVLVPAEPAQETRPLPQFSSAAEYFTVAVTGFATFALEIAWFRALTSAFKSTTVAFAIMLSSVLLALGLAARLVPLFKARKANLGTLLGWAGILILLATPLIERFDLIAPATRNASLNWAVIASGWFAMTFYVIGPSVLLLGIAFPWIIDEQHKPREWGGLYALNTLAAIAGSLGAAWILLPAIGFARTAWLAGVLVAATGVLLAPRDKRLKCGLIAVAALCVAVVFESGAGKTRVLGDRLYSTDKKSKVLEAYEGPAATVSVVEYTNGMRRLIINGSSASGQSVRSDTLQGDHYMPWMGFLPMMLTPDPKNALVICFGTGQTANAVRHENPQSLDIVDINPQVFTLAHNFTANENVLGDPRVKPIVMDGRAYMRRTSKMYDVITLEPMPPILAGVNALYSREFYELARQRLSAKGVIAQWLPYYASSPHYSASIARTFQSVFPNSILWLDPNTKADGILLGTKDESVPLGSQWYGFKRPDKARNIPDDQVRAAVILDPKGMERYGKFGEEITDDNQLLAYGKAIYSAMPMSYFETLVDRNIKLLYQVKNEIAK